MSNSRNHLEEHTGDFGAPRLDPRHQNQNTQEHAGDSRIPRRKAIATLDSWDPEFYRLSKEGRSSREIASQFGFRDHHSILNRLRMLPANVELAERILGELKNVGFARDRGVASQKAIFERKRQMGLYLGPSIQWGCHLENGKLVPDVKKIQRLWTLVRKTRNPRQSAITMGFKHPEGVYPVLRSHRYVKLGAISQEDFDAVLKIMAENLRGRLQPPLGLRYDGAGNLAPGKRFPLIVKIFTLRRKQKTLDEIEAATRVDRAQVHKILNNHVYKNFLDAVDPSLWRGAQNVKINGVQRMHDWARERKRETLAKIRTRLSQRQASARQLGKVAGVFWSVVLEYLKPLIKNGEVERVRNGNRVFYRLSRQPPRS